MTKADLLVERGASFLEDLARKLASDGGTAAKFAEPLAEDAEFLRKLKPSLVAARLRGEPTPDGRRVELPERAPSPSRPSSADGRGPSLLVVAGAAFVIGVVVAKFVDWRGHAHPRD